METGELCSPSKSIIIPDNMKLPSFLSNMVNQDKQPVHHCIASQEEAVKQLKRCGVKVMDIDTVKKDIVDIIYNLQSQEYDPKQSGQYDLSVDACIWLINHGFEFQGKIVAFDGTLQLPQYTFLPSGYLDWDPLWRAGFLPGYFPINSAYSKTANQYGLSSGTLYQKLQESGVHGFSKENDKGLISLAAESISIKNLIDEGHQPEKVSDHDKLGYDLICKGHCDKVFEVKGMNDPADISLQASEVDKAKEFGKRYLLICIYNLPCDLGKIGYKIIPDPQQIWIAEEKARINKKQWMQW